MENKEKDKKSKKGEPEVVPVSPAVDEIEQELEAKDGEPADETLHKKLLENAQKEALYLKAEFENYKRRILKEQESAIKFANEKFISEMVTVADHMDRAMSSAKPLKAKAEGTPLQNELNNFSVGIELTQRELVNLLARFGVEFIGTVGEKFDPGRHEAISQQETSPEKAGTVLEVFQKGSLLHGRLLAPARVVVGRAK